MALYNIVIITVLMVTLKAEDDIKDFEFSSGNDGEMMIAQESRQYSTVVKPPIRIIKPTGVTNSHRPQYNVDSYEADATNEELEDYIEPTTKRSVAKHYKSSSKLRAKEGMIRDAVLRALERKDHVGKFAQILPIVRAMSGSQRVALASLVASQVSTPPGRMPLSLAQVRSMFGNNANTTTDLMLPILLDLANLIRRAVRSGKEPREVKLPLLLPRAQLLRRSFIEDDDTTLDDEPFDMGYEDTEPKTTTNAPKQSTQNVLTRKINIRPQRTNILHTRSNTTNTSAIVEKSPLDHNRTTTNNSLQDDTKEQFNNVTEKEVSEENKNASQTTTSTVETTTVQALRTRPFKSSLSKSPDNSTLDLTAAATNQTLAQDLPVAEKLRALNRFVDRNGNFIRRGTYLSKPLSASRRTTAEPNLSPVNSIHTRRRLPPARKLPPAPMNMAEQAKCELFTNTLCLHSDDYPTEAIIQSIRRNKAAAGALLADFRDPAEGAVDGVTAAQEAKYTSDHYLVSNRRGDTASRDFAGAGEAGFMCPSTVKYARPQRARATSGQWKYIVNTGEHTQTLRLEKCLKPKESCTYLTDNFKSKCVQVYNYHRLLTWDQQNGLHMDIFKVPTCCSCHIEGYSVSFPPLGHRNHETTSAERYPAEDLSSEHRNHAFDTVQTSVQRPSLSKTPPFSSSQPIDSFPPFTENQNTILTSFTNAKSNDNDEFSNGNSFPSNAMDSYGNSYFPDSFNQASSSVRNIKRPPSGRKPVDASNFDSATLPSFLEPPTPLTTSSFSFIKETQNKYKIGNQFKRGALRPNRRPIRKKISGGTDDLISSGTSAIEAFTSSNLETMENSNEDEEESEISKTNIKINFPKRATITPKLHVITTEKSTTIVTPQEQSQTFKSSTNNKKVNYNYHPIIDFFDEGDKDIGDESIDREDSISEYVPSLESEWKPIDHPPSRNIQTTNTVGRKKHK